MNGTVDYELTKKILAALEREGVRYIVFGAVAINLLGLARATEDLDLFVAPEADNIERLKAALRSVFNDPSIDEIKADELLGDYPAVEYVPPEGNFHIDILTRLGEAFRFEDLEAQRQDFDGVPVSVASPKTLYRMKKDTVRLKDRADAEALKRRFRIEED
jgi:nucleotidyltransferase AbiEii toxin of type IV toxin-antitoxin system